MTTKTLYRILEENAENIREMPCESDFEERKEGDYRQDPRVSLTYRRRFVQSAGAIGSLVGSFTEEIEFRRKGEKEMDPVVILRRVGEKYTLKYTVECARWGSEVERNAALRLHELAIAKGDE